MKHNPPDQIIENSAINSKIPHSYKGRRLTKHKRNNIMLKLNFAFRYY